MHSNSQGKGITNVLVRQRINLAHDPAESHGQDVW